MHQRILNSLVRVPMIRSRRLSTLSDTITFTNWNGDESISVALRTDGQTSILEAAQEGGVPLEGACEGSLSCSTCHVIISDPKAFDALPKPSEAEEDMLDVAAGRTATSRLSCCLFSPVAGALNGLQIRLPPLSADELATGPPLQNNILVANKVARIIQLEASPILKDKSARRSIRLDEIRVSVDDDPGGSLVHALFIVILMKYVDRY